MNKNMNKNLTFEELRIKNKERCELIYHPISEWSEADWCCALVGESGELANFIKKRRRLNYQNDAYLEDIYKEMGDVASYLDLLATRLGVRLEDCLVNKFNLVSDKKNCKIKLGQDE